MTGKSGRILCAAALLCLVLTVPVHAQQESVVTVTYEQLEQQLLAGNAALRQDESGREALRLQLAQRKKEHKKLMDLDVPLSMISASAEQLQKEMKRLQLLLDMEPQQRQRLLDDQLYEVQLRYLEQYRMENQRDLAALAAQEAGRALREIQNLHQVGMAAQEDVDKAERQLEQAQQALQILEGACRDNLTALARQLGLAGEIRLGGVPQFLFDEIPNRDLQADQAAYCLNAPEVRRRELAVEEAELTLDLSKSDADRYALKQAQAEYTIAQEFAGQEFSGVYQSLLEQYERWSRSAALTAAQENYDTLVRQYRQGLVSRRSMEQGEYQLSTAQLRRAEESLALGQALLTYEFSLGGGTAAQETAEQ